MRRLSILSLCALLLLAPVTPLLAKGGGGRGGGFSSSRSSSYSSKPASQAKPPSQSSFKTTAPKPVAAPPVKTTSSLSAKGKAITSKPSNSRYARGKARYLNSDYRFSRGYTAPAGSAVYYRSSAWDWFPFYYLATHGSHKDAVVVQPDGKEVEVKEEGVDGMYIFNWIVVILLGLGFIGLIAWLVYKFTNKGGSYE